jgi:hypothetical protein
MDSIRTTGKNACRACGHYPELKQPAASTHPPPTHAPTHTNTSFNATGKQTDLLSQAYLDIVKTQLCGYSSYGHYLEVKQPAASTHPPRTHARTHTHKHIIHATGKQTDLLSQAYLDIVKTQLCGDTRSSNSRHKCWWNSTRGIFTVTSVIYFAF